jgi:hypothetical protein
MAFDRFLIAPYDDGMRTDLEPWLIPDQSFETLFNAYVWRGRVRKRFGGQLMGTGAISDLDAPLLSRLRYQIGVTAGGGLAGIVPNFPYSVGAQFSASNIIFTVYQAAGQMYRTDGLAAAATFDLASGAYVIAGTGLPDGTPVFFYPDLPVMGLTNYELGPINNQPSYGFDTKWVYKFVNGWDRSGAAQNVVFHGSDSQFFWTTNWTGVIDNQVALFVTNFNVTNQNGAPVATDDPIWTYIDSPAAPIPWATFSPSITTLPGPTHDKIYQARIIVPFKDRLVLLNVIEQNAAGNANKWYPSRCRYSHNGSPFDADAFIQVNNTGFKGGGYIDAATEEQIVSAEFIKDRLIVYFERSTWELAYTGNHVLPFVWQKINTELGAESTFSVVPFDKAVLGIGNTGVHACSGANVERIDTKIPNQVFQIANKSEGVKRVIGIRDYYVEMVYWTFPNSEEDAIAKYPNTVLVYNYKTNSWAFNDDCITMFGYYEQQSGVIWASLTMPWHNNNSTWSSGVQQAQFRQVIAGNQQGYTFIVDADISNNAPVMSITDIQVIGTVMQLTIINHTLSVGDWIYINSCQGVTGINDANYEVSVVIDPNTVQIPLPPNFAGIYTGGGNITRVSLIDMLTKEFNPYIDKGRNVYVAKIDFGVRNINPGVLPTQRAEITVDYFPSSTDVSMIQNGTATNTILGTSVLETSPYINVPIEANSERLWHPIYFQSEGECIQLRIYLSTAEMRNTFITQSDFWLEGMVLHTMPTASRLE